MRSINKNTRGLSETFYVVYEKVLQDLIQMGVLVTSSEMTSVRWMAHFLLNNFGSLKRWVHKTQ